MNFLHKFHLQPVFQSSPDPEAGCNLLSDGRVVTFDAFQSSPDPEAGCNRGYISEDNMPTQVSILTRPGGRVQRDYQPSEVTA